MRTTALQVIAGLAVLAGAVLAFQQLTEDRRQATTTQELTRQGQASERFTRAIDQLGSDRREVQLGGIYGLEQIAQQAPDNRLAVAEVLVAYLHRRAPRPAKPTTRHPTELRVRAPDIHAVLTVLGRRQIAPDDPPLDLRALDLFGADVSEANLSEANLSDANLTRADLSGASLTDANLSGASLTDANLTRANLSGADLHTATLSGADLTGVTLSDADLTDANLSTVDISEANLSGADLTCAKLSEAYITADISGVTFPADLTRADLSGANVSRADLIDSDLVGADLTGANLRGAYLRGAKLGGANLSGANLSGADLRSADLRGAIADQATYWPDGFDWRPAGITVTADRHVAACPVY